jgi:hypothetical protein
MGDYRWWLSAENMVKARCQTRIVEDPGSIELGRYTSFNLLRLENTWMIGPIWLPVGSAIYQCNWWTPLSVLSVMIASPKLWGQHKCSSWACGNSPSIADPDERRGLGSLCALAKIGIAQTLWKSSKLGNPPEMRYWMEESSKNGVDFPLLCLRQPEGTARGLGLFDLVLASKSRGPKSHVHYYLLAI